MALHFAPAEFAARQEAARAAIRAAGLDALLIFAQESHYYLTGYDTIGYVWFQCGLLMPETSHPYALLIRMPDVQNARITSVVEDIRVWSDDGVHNPALDLKALLTEKGLAGAHIGIETATHGLTGANWERVRQVLQGWCTFEDASMLVRRLRVVKSPAELAYVRRAAAIADNAMLTMVEATRPGAFEGDIAAAGQSTLLRSGGDVAPSGPTIGSGQRALSGRASTGPVHLAGSDQLTIEFASTYRRYNACLMRTICVGAASAQQEKMFAATREALLAATQAARPGHPLGDIYDAHQRVFDAAGFGHLRRPSCGYSLGATYRPTWMDAPPMLQSTNMMLAMPGMTLFLHAIIMDPELILAMSAGHTIIVTDTACEVLSRLPLDLIMRT